MKRIIFISFYISFHTLFSSFAAESKTDSLEKILMAAEDDTFKVNLLIDLAEELKGSDPAKSIMYAEQAATISRKLNYKYGIAAGTNNIGIVYYRQGNYNTALKFYFEALKIREEMNDMQGISMTKNNIGIVYMNMNEHDKALDFYMQSLQAAEAIKNPDRKMKHYKSNTLNNIGIIYRLRNDNENALTYYTLSLEIRKAINDKGGIAGNLANIGNIFSSEKKYEKALEHHRQALKIYEQLNDRQGIAICLGNICGVYSAMKNYSDAITYCNKCIELALEIDSKEDVKESYLTLAQMYAEQQEYKKAYEYYKLFSSIKDSILNEESSKQIAEMQTKYETEKKEQQITLLNKDKELQSAELNRQQIIIWSVAAGLLVVLILSIFIFRERKKSEKLLLNILPAETARELKENGKAKAKHYESVTVMFTDFKGFTNIAEKLSAEELVSELDFLFKKFDEIISKYNIEKIKTIGDAYMCVSGLPTPNTDHAEEIIKAAMEMQQWMASPQTTPGPFSPLHPDSYREERGLRGEARWQLRIGIHSGPVTAGVVGDKKFAYDIWGDTVNTASRMESSGEAGKINVSGATYEMIKNQLITNDSGLKTVFRGKIPAKNKGEIEMYFVEMPPSGWSPAGRYFVEKS